LGIHRPQTVSSAHEGDRQRVRRHRRVGLDRLRRRQPHGLGSVDSQAVDIAATGEHEHRRNLLLGSGRSTGERRRHCQHGDQRDAREHSSMISPSYGRV